MVTLQWCNDAVVVPTERRQLALCVTAGVKWVEGVQHLTRSKRVVHVRTF